jgi:diacylglycerol kinase (ATP)
LPGEHALGRPLVIANPAAGSGRAPVLPRLCAVLDDLDVGYDVEVTGGPGHATHLARTAVVDAGRTFLIAVGGDGTVHEVVNGMVDATERRLLGEDPVLAVVSAGSGGDLIRTFGLDRPVERLAHHLASETVMPVDLGHVTFQGDDGRTREAVFANAAEAGFGGRVVATAAKLPRRLGTSRYAVGIVLGWGGFRRVRTTITVDAGSVTAEVCNVLVANGQFLGGGMRAAPRALPDDGRFNVQAWGGSVTDVVRGGRQLRRGTHLERPDVREWQSTTVTVESERPLLVEADGELLGTTPARFEVLPRLLRLKL